MNGWAMAARTASEDRAQGRESFELSRCEGIRRGIAVGLRDYLTWRERPGLTAIYERPDLQT